MRKPVNYAKYLTGLVLGLAVLMSCLTLQVSLTRPALVSNVRHSPHSTLSPDPADPEMIPTPRVPISIAALPEPDQTTQARVLEAYGKLPMRFEANRGQADSQVKFLSRGSGYTLFLTSNEAVLALRKDEGGRMKDEVNVNNASSLSLHPSSFIPSSAPAMTVLRMKFIGANLTPRVLGLEELPGKSHYFIGNHSSSSGGWHTEVPNYAKVEYQNVYPGVNLVYYGNQQQLEYDFVVAPGADPRAITLGFQGADQLKIDAQGDLLLRMSGREIRQHKPLIYQEINGAKQAIAGHYVLRGKHEAGFQLAAYDDSRPLIIDPRLKYSTYLGSSGDDQGFGIAVDAAGNAYVTGQTSSVNFPRSQNTYGGGLYDAFVMKLNAAGNVLVYSTYLGGSGDDYGRSIAVDAAGNAYVTGVTNSTDFPTTAGSFQRSNRGGSDAFVAKLNAAGNALFYSTYLGGDRDDAGLSIAVDSSRNAYVTGRTASANFPTRGPLQPALGGQSDAFVTKLNDAGNALVYSTYLGGSLDDIGFGIAVDTSGSAYVTGETASNNFPTARPFQDRFYGVRDVFVTKFNAAGNMFIYSTYFGLFGADAGHAIAVESSSPGCAGGCAYVTGSTSSFDLYPDTRYSGNIDAFVMKFSADGSELLYFRYLGGSGMDDGRAIAVDATGNAYVTGTTTSKDFPTARPLESMSRGRSDVFVTKLNAFDGTIDHSTYFGGGGSDVGRGIAVDTMGNIYVTGATNSNDFRTLAPYQRVNRGGLYDAFIVKIGQTIPVSVTLDPPRVPSGTASIGTVTLNDRALPPSGADVNLSSSNPNVAQVPDTVTVRAGENAAVFRVDTGPVAANTPVTISASRNGVTKTATLTVEPAILASLRLDPTTVTGGTPSTGTITLNGLAPPSGAVVTLSSDNPAATVPASVTVPAGENAADFTVQTTAVTESTSVTISASYRGVTKTATLLINP